jgi:hypothetical protein
MRVKRTDVGGKVVEKEHPSLAGFRPWDLAGAGFGKHGGGVHLEKSGRLLHAHRTHRRRCLAASLIGR